MLRGTCSTFKFLPHPCQDYGRFATQGHSTNVSLKDWLGTVICTLYIVHNAGIAKNKEKASIGAVYLENIKTSHEKIYNFFYLMI